MTPHETVRVLVFTAGISFMAGAGTVWRFAKAFERYRRSRVDLKMTVGGIRGQMESIRDNFLRMAKLAGVVSLVVVCVGIGLYQLGKGK